MYSRISKPFIWTEDFEKKIGVTYWFRKKDIIHNPHFTMAYTTLRVCSIYAAGHETANDVKLDISAFKYHWYAKNQICRILNFFSSNFWYCCFSEDWCEVKIQSYVELLRNNKFTNCLWQQNVFAHFFLCPVCKAIHGCI